jgi:hypothetical protein
MIRHKDFGRIGQATGQEGKSAYQVLVDAGWKPPNTLPGLPAPSVMDLLPARKEVKNEIETTGSEPSNGKGKV